MGTEIIPQMPQTDRPISVDWGREVVKCLRALWPLQGDGVLLERHPNGTMISVSGGAQAVSSGAADDGLYPFKVRWHQHGNNGGAWEVYLPWGCASVWNSACIPTNTQAKDAEGNDEIGWYTFEIAENDSVETARVGNRIYRSCPVYALMKPWPHVTVSTARADYENKPWHAKKVIAYAQEAEWTANGKTQTARRVVQYVKTAWSETLPSSAELFAIRYDPQGDASNPATTWKAMLTNMTVTCGRFQVSSPYDVDVTNMATVVLKINHAVDGEYSLEIVGEPGVTDDYATYVNLYRLDGGVVTSDLRTNITTMPFFDV